VYACPRSACSPPSLHADAGRQLRVADADGAAALHTQPLEFGPLRESIRAGLGGGAHPHLILRFGMVIQAAGSVRRPPDDALSASGGDDTETAEG
jgi:hypothetical protein